MAQGQAVVHCVAHWLQRVASLPAKALPLLRRVTLSAARQLAALGQTGKRPLKGVGGLHLPSEGAQVPCGWDLMEIVRPETSEGREVTAPAAFLGFSGPSWNGLRRKARL